MSGYNNDTTLMMIVKNEAGHTLLSLPVLPGYFFRYISKPPSDTSMPQRVRRQWIASLYSNAFRAEREPSLSSLKL